MDQQLLIQHLEKSLIGRLRLKLFQKISINNSIPDPKTIQSFILENLESSLIVGELYAATFMLSNFSCQYCDQLKGVTTIEGLLKALEKFPFPLEEPFFIELTECSQPFPETLGILIKCSELADVDYGFVYSVYLLDEEKFPETIIDYIEVRACKTMPDPIVCSNTIDGRSTSNLKKITGSLNVQLALKALYFFLKKRIKEEKKRQQSEIVKATKLTHISENLSARFLRQASGRMELAIIVGEETSAEELRSVWSKIDFLRTRLREQQGSNLNQIQYSLLYNYYQMHQNGWSYNLIAMDINYDCLVDLCHACDEIIDINARIVSSPSFSHAIRLLQSVRMKEKDILDCLLDGLKEIRNANSPWSLQNGPVDKQRVRDALRQWEREQTSQQVIVQKPPTTQTVPIDTLMSPYTKRYQQMAKELLRKTFPNFDSYEQYHIALTKTMTETGYIGNPML